MPSLVMTPPDALLIGPQTFGFFDDLEGYVTGDRFTAIAADGGASVARTDAAGGRVALTTGGTDNNEAYLGTSQEVFLFANDKPLVFEARLQYAEANTDDANLYVGLMDAVAANALVDDGGGPKASFSGAGFYKVDGGTRWQVISSLAANRTVTDLTAVNTLTKLAYTAGGSSFVTLRIEFMPLSSTSADVIFYINGVNVVKHQLTYTSATEMDAVVGVKAGGANSEVVTVDYIACYQTR